MKKVTLQDAPKCLNTNDAAFWVVGWNECVEKNISPDSNVEKNREMLLQRSIVGLAKHGVTTDNNPLTLRAWLQHALEEALDMANYLQAAISKLDEEGVNHDNANRQ